MFSNTLNWTMPRGTLLPHPQTGGRVPVPYDQHIFTTTTASGFLKGSVFSGNFSSAIEIAPMLPRTVLKRDFVVTLS